jgi:hypothetical protein
MALKHVGRVKTNRARVVVAYRTIPGDPYSALVIPTASLPADEHDTLIKAVESDAGQNAFEFYEVMQRTVLPDGRNMLVGFHQRGNLRKYPTADIEMVPDSQTVINLNELNALIAQQRGIALEDLAVPASAKDTKKADTTVNVLPVEELVIDEPAVESTPNVLTDDQLAAQYRSQADALFKEAKRLREEADALSPTKKKITKKTESAQEA